MIVIREALAGAAQALAASSEAPRLDAEVLLAHAAGLTRTALHTHPETRLSWTVRERFDALLNRRVTGESLPYLIGHWEFFGLDFDLSPGVLIPRPESELLVETVIQWANTLSVTRPLSAGALHLADIGTGSGCIAVSLAVNLPEASIYAVDILPAALAVAETNALRHQVAGRIQFLRGDLLAPLPGPVDVLCANLPYIDSDELAWLPVARYEPRVALDGGRGGLGLISRLLAEAPGALNPGGLALFEIGATQGPAALDLARAACPQAAVEIRQDLAGLDRLLVIQL